MMRRSASIAGASGGRPSGGGRLSGGGRPPGGHGECSWRREFGGPGRARRRAQAVGHGIIALDAHQPPQQHTRPRRGGQKCSQVRVVLQQLAQIAAIGRCFLGQQQTVQLVRNGRLGLALGGRCHRRGIAGWAEIEECRPAPARGGFGRPAEEFPGDDSEAAHGLGMAGAQHRHQRRPHGLGTGRTYPESARHKQAETLEQA